jgi:hypothetical protein
VDLKDASLREAPTLLANIRLSWKGQPGTNTLAYCNNSKNIDVKSFLTFCHKSHGFEYRHYRRHGVRENGGKKIFVIISPFK